MGQMPHTNLARTRRCRRSRCEESPPTVNLLKCAAELASTATSYRFRTARVHHGTSAGRIPEVAGDLSQVVQFAGPVHGERISVSVEECRDKPVSFGLAIIALLCLLPVPEGGC